MLVVGSIRQRTISNSNPVSGGTVVVGSVLDLGSSLCTVTLNSTVVTTAGTYTIFQTTGGIISNGVLQSAGVDLMSKVDVRVPSGYAVQSIYVDSTGKNVCVVVRTAGS